MLVGGCMTLCQGVTHTYMERNLDTHDSLRVIKIYIFWGMTWMWCVSSNMYLVVKNIIYTTIWIYLMRLICTCAHSVIVACTCVNNNVKGVGLGFSWYLDWRRHYPECDQEVKTHLKKNRRRTCFECWTPLDMTSWLWVKVQGCAWV